MTPGKALIRTTICIGFLCLKQMAFGQYKVYMSEEGIRRFFRVSAGYSQWGLRVSDSVIVKAQGVHLRNEGKFISPFLPDDISFAFLDAFYVEMNIGGMSTKRREKSDEKESGISFDVNFGVLLMPGYRTAKFSVYGGIDFKWASTYIGGYSTPTSPLFYAPHPFVVRGEYRLAKEFNSYPRIALMVWQGRNLGSSERYQSVRADFAFTEKGNWWFFGQLTSYGITVDDNFYFQPTSNGRFQQFILGFRVGMVP